MATTDSRTGFRLPWSTDQRQATEPAESTEPAPADAVDSGTPAEFAASAETEAPVETIGATDSDAPSGGPDTPSGEQIVETSDADAPGTEPGSAPVSAVTAPTAAASPAPSRKPNKFLADLTKAMQAAAEAAREDSIARFSGDAKAFVEQIHTRSAEESAGLQRRADDDINRIRDSSKAEIARIREETEERIADRRTRLERETETHAAQIDHEIERVQGRVADFEAEMARFFERLLAEDDPTRFAALAENLPEPPSFDVAEALAEAAAWTAPVEEPARADEPAPTTPEPVAEGSTEFEPATPPTESVDPWADATWSADAPASSDTPDTPPSFVDPDAAFAAIQAAAEAAEGVETSESTEPSATEPSATESTESEPSESDADPRLAMIGLDPDFAAAEAEAFAIDAAAAEAEEIPAIGEEALAARLAGFMPATEVEASSESQVTRVVVVGLVSVASIASFKRHLGRLPGVQAVGVSSGPDGEFVFAVTHEPGLALTDTVPTLPGFQARVTGSEDGAISVTAHDPESDS